jgi:hypothetical protein
MTNWHIQRPGRFINEPDGYAGLTVVTGINAVKSSWAENIASLSQDAYGIWVQNRVIGMSGQEYSIDIGIGSSGNEVALIEEFMCPFISSSSRYGVGIPFYLPFFIPAGTRIVSRGRTDHTNSSYVNVYCGLGIIGDSPMSPLFGRSQWMNVDTSIPKGRDVNPGGTINTWGSWTALQDGPLAFDAKWCFVSITTNDTTRPSASWRLQLGVGGSGSEVVIGDFISYSHSSGDFQSTPHMWFPVDIPANTTISNRAMCDAASDNIINTSYYFFG